MKRGQQRWTGGVETKAMRRRLTIKLEERRNQRLKEVGDLTLLRLLVIVDLGSILKGRLGLGDVGVKLKEVVGICDKEGKGEISIGASFSALRQKGEK